MARKDAVNRGRGVMYQGKLIRPKLLKKKLARLEREQRKAQSFYCMPYGGVVKDKEAEKGLAYLYSEGLIDV